MRKGDDMKKLISTAAAASVMLTATASPAFSAGNIPMDYNSDGRVDAFDVVAARQSDASGAELKAVSDFVLGKKVSSAGGDTEFTIDESCILEPKGTVHTGEGTFYGGGYEGGHAMLDPVSRDYWIVAMNHSDYNNAQLAGAYLEVTGELGTINMLVTDELPEGKKGDLDL